VYLAVFHTYTAHLYDTYRYPFVYRIDSDVVAFLSNSQTITVPYLYVYDIQSDSPIKRMPIFRLVCDILIYIYLFQFGLFFFLFLRR